ncbi:MAG: hypothetical protein ABWY02_01645, partial [Telluria sp.]
MLNDYWASGIAHDARGSPHPPDEASNKRTRQSRHFYYGEAGIMTDAADDFDALFEEVAAQRASAA